MRKEFGVREEVSQKMERSWFLSSHSGQPRRRPGATRNPGISGNLDAGLRRHDERKGVVSESLQ